MTTRRKLSLRIDQLARIIRGEAEIEVAARSNEESTLDALVDALETLDPAAMETLMEVTGGGVAASRAAAIGLYRQMHSKGDRRRPVSKMAVEPERPQRELDRSCDLFAKEFPFVREVFKCGHVHHESRVKMKRLRTSSGDVCVVFIRSQTNPKQEIGWRLGWGLGIGMRCKPEFSPLPAMLLEQRKLSIDE